MDFTEKHFTSYDTIGELFSHPLIELSIGQYKEDMKDHIPGASYENIPDGDVIREIFKGELNYESFLRILRSNISKSGDVEDDEYIPTLISIILSISQLKDDIGDSPVSIKSLMNEKLMNVINYGKEKKYCFDSDNKIDYSKYEGIRTLITLGFPCIDENGFIVYYAEGSGKNDVIRIWNEEIGMFHWMNKEGKRIDEKDVDKIDLPQKQDTSHISLASSTTKLGPKSKDASHLKPVT